MTKKVFQVINSNSSGTKKKKKKRKGAQVQDGIYLPASELFCWVNYAKPSGQPSAHTEKGGISIMVPKRGFSFSFICHSGFHSYPQTHPHLYFVS